jgi:glycosyltransferase involved in cell wall biosynthesis
MRALLVTRPNASSHPGGDTTVLRRAAAALVARGIAADVVETATPDADGYDVAHVFGLFDPDVAEAQIDAIRRTRTPLVVSPICWDRSALFALAPRLARALAARDPDDAERLIARLRAREDGYVRAPGRGAIRWVQRQSALLQRCDVALPASEIEAFACANHLHVYDRPYVVAPYGVDDDAFQVERPSARAGVVCVGRLEPLKNQALLLFALRDVDVDVTLVGGQHDAAYVALCRRWATGRTRFIERLPGAELQRLVTASAVHVLPSWADLPGLVSLEAAALGTHVVAGTRGSEREYLGPDVDYVDPLDPQGIRAAVTRALRRPARERGDALDLRLVRLSWDLHAERTIAAYARAAAAS